MIHTEPDVKLLEVILAKLDSWNTDLPCRQIDCEIAFALGHDWFDERGFAWRELVSEQGFGQAWTLPPVWEFDLVPKYTSSFDAVFAQMRDMMPEIDNVHFDSDPSGASATVGVWHMSTPYRPGEADMVEAPYIWPNAKCYNHSPHYALLGAFLTVVLQHVRGDKPSNAMRADAPSP